MKAVPSASRPLRETELLGLEPGHLTPAQIIWAAQVRLRRFRRGQLGDGIDRAPVDAKQIMAARDTLLRQTVGVITRRGLRPPAS
jgi:hypothetical protein